MTESTFIFICFITGLLVVFGIGALICDLYLSYKAKKYHLTIMNKVLKLEQLQIRK